MTVLGASMLDRLDDAASWSVPEKVLRTLAVYLTIVVLLRIFGKRELAQLNSFDLVVLLLLSNVVQNAVIGPETSLWGGLLGAATLLGANAVVVRLVKLSDRVDDLFEGTKTEIVHDGNIDAPAVTRLGLRRGDVLNALRRQGAHRLDTIERAWIYPGGAVVVDLKHGAEPATRSDIDRLEQELDRVVRLLGERG